MLKFREAAEDWGEPKWDLTFKIRINSKISKIKLCFDSLMNRRLKKSWIIRNELVLKLNFLNYLSLVSTSPRRRKRWIYLTLSFMLYIKCFHYNVRVDLFNRNMWLWINPYPPIEVIQLMPILIAQISFSHGFKLGKYGQIVTTLILDFSLKFDHRWVSMNRCIVKNYYKWRICWSRNFASVSSHEFYEMPDNSVIDWPWTTHNSIYRSLKRAQIKLMLNSSKLTEI